MQKLSFNEMHLKMSSAKVAAILPGLNVLTSFYLFEIGRHLGSSIGETPAKFQS